jgi:hypothetical protein
MNNIGNKKKKKKKSKNQYLKKKQINFSYQELEE